MLKADCERILQTKFNRETFRKNRKIIEKEAMEMLNSNLYLDDNENDFIDENNYVIMDKINDDNKEQLENYLGRKITDEEFKNNKKELDEEYKNKFAEYVRINEEKEEDEEFTCEDLMSILNEDDFRKMRGMTQEQIEEYEKNICKEIGIPYPTKF